jgi:hypothetical protein
MQGSFQELGAVGVHLKKVANYNEIVERLKSKKEALRDETQQDRWRKIYMLLFPGALAPSLCKLDYDLC